MCTFTYKEGALESIELAKDDARKLMIKRIDKLTAKTAYDNFKNVKIEKERILVEAFKHDPQLSDFVDSQLIYKKVKHEGEEKITFVKACIEKKDILYYEQERLEKLKKDIMINRSDTALEDLEKEFTQTQ
jgi:hypothetical protein